MTRQEKQSSPVRLGFAVAAAFFLFNPNIMLLDILPDFIGYLLLLTAFSSLAEILPHFDSAVSGFRRMTLVTLLRYPAFYLMSWVYFNETSERPIVPLLCLSFGALELIFAIPAFRALFTGMEYAAARSDCPGLLYLPQKAAAPSAAGGKKKKRKKKLISLSRLSALTTVMLIVKAAAELLPELTFLTSSDSLGYITSHSLNILHYRPYFLVFAGGISLLSGVIWLCRYLSYFRAVSKNQTFLSYLSVGIAEQHRISPESQRDRIFLRASVLLIAGFALQIDLFSNARSILPDFLGILLLLIGSAELTKAAPRNRAVPVSGSIAAGISLLATVSNLIFLHHYDYEAVGRIASAGQPFLLVLAATLAEQAALLIFLVFLSRQLSETARRCASYPGDELNDLSAQKIPVWKLLSHRFTLSRIFAAASGVTTLLLLLSRTDTIRMRTRNSGAIFYAPRVGWGWILHFAVTLIWILYSTSAILALRREAAYAAEAKSAVEQDDQE